MRKSIFLLALASVAGLTASARGLNPSEALERALSGRVLPVSRSAAAPELVMTLGSSEAPAIYVFNRADGGYMIVSADDVAAPLIAYSETGSIDPENLPENLRGWLEQSRDQIVMASAAGVEPYTETVSRAADRDPIEPLMTTLWDQSSPYNKYCPKVGTTPTYTGCVATAMAQVMKYFNWPDKASDKANLSYQWYTGETVTLSEDFRNYEFDWKNMLDAYTSGYDTAQADAVAKLMQACGYSVNMAYGTSSSGAFAANVGNGLVEYFKYDAGLHNEARELYSAAQWEEMIYNNLRDFGPIVYWGSGSGSHCFVCDGYQANGYFHFNWGWSGMSDGWYRLNMLTPGSTGIGGSSGGFNNGQGALLGVKPAGDTVSERVYTFYASRGITEAFADASTVSLYGNFWNFSPYTIKADFVLRVYKTVDGEEGDYLTSYTADIPYAGTYYSNNYENAFYGTIPASLQDGTYHIYPAVRFGGKEYVYRTPAGYANYVVYERSKGVNTISIPEVAKLTVDNLSTNGDFYMTRRFRISGIAKFDGVGDTDRYVTASLLRADGSVCGTGSSVTIKFSEEGTPFEFVSDWFTKSGLTADIQPGEYTFALQCNYKTIASCPVTIRENVTEGDFRILSTKVESISYDPQFTTIFNVVVSAEIEGTKGVVDDQVTFYLRRQLTPVGYETPASFFVTEGQKAKVTATIKAYNPLTAWEHTLYCGYKSGSSFVAGKTVSFNFYFDDDFSGIADVDADNSDAPVEYFNLQGVAVDGNNLTPGIYIRRQGSKTVKFLVK